MAEMKGKHIVGSIIGFLAIGLLSGQLANAGDGSLTSRVSSGVSWATGALSGVSERASSFANTNVIQPVKSTAGGIVTRFAGRQAGTIVANGAWRNVLSASGAKTAAKIMLSTGAGVAASQAPVEQILRPIVGKKNVPKAVGDKVWNTNLTNVYKATTSKLVTYSEGKRPSGILANGTNATYRNATNSVNIKH